jgi:predicted nucleotidyltransferase
MLSDAAIRELARGVLGGWVYGRKQVDTTCLVRRDEDGTVAVLVWVEIPNLYLAQEQYHRNTGKAVEEARD